MTKNSYSEMKERQQHIVDNFNGWFFAFTNDQFDEGMKKVGLNPDETSKVVRIGGGGFVKKDRLKAMEFMFDSMRKEMQEAIDADKTGTGFIYDMFRYELENHEYGYTGELDETLESLDLTMEDINANPALLNGLGLAIEKVMECSFA